MHKLWDMDKQGGLTYSVQEHLLKTRYAADSGWEHPAAAIPVMLICGTLDFVVFQQLFAAILYDQLLIQWLSVIGCLIAFDLAPIYLGVLMKKRSQGMRINLFAASALALSFALVLAGNIWLRITVKDILLPPDPTAGMSLFGSGGAAESDPAALPYAIFSSMLPLATSLVSFVVSYISSDSLRGRIRLLHAQQLKLQEAAAQIRAILAEYQADPDFQDRLMRADDEQYDVELAAAEEQGFRYADQVRQRNKEYLGEESAANELSKDERRKLCRLLDRIDARTARQQQAESGIHLLKKEGLNA